ncbi:MAG TPA: RagB/SusD family nutrient uptake outer membrane protein [Bacteroidales bacterium]|nr:RagB/SusD family nutrient uptake outer membrane protein [Bacteroidales bacterium]
MRKRLIYTTLFTLLFFLGACKDFLELEPLDKVSKEYLLSTPAGVKTLMATLYNRLPIEDFDYRPGTGFNVHPGGGTYGDCGWSLSANSDEAIIMGASGYTSNPTSGLAEYWDYQGVRYVNQFLADILDMKNKGKLTDALYNQLYGEAHFIRAGIYFAMAKRYGGVPLISDVQSLPTGDITSVMVPRSTEKATYDFVMSEYDLAIANLPDARPSDGTLRATKWVALAHKSRAALHAASIAKYWNKPGVTLAGQAVTDKLVGGFTTTDANDYYLQCLNASKQIIDNTAFSLYKPNPASKEEAAKNYQDMFESPSYSNPEIIYMKAYIDGSSASGQGHVTDFWFYPKQNVFHTLYVSSRWGTTLDVVDAFEDYSDNGQGLSKPIRTRTDNNETSYVADPKGLTNAQLAAIPFVYYNNQYEPFIGKDARLQASVLLPGSTFKGTLINMQGGLIQSTGKAYIYTDNESTGLDGKKYYTYGTLNEGGYSAFGKMGTAAANYSSTGFALRKFLQDSKNVTSYNMFGSTQGWIDIRLAEIYLNYAEAYLESGQGDAALAGTLLNSIRKRAAHTDNIPLTIDNVLKERRVELIFENSRYWDLIRRRDMHSRFSSNARRHSLIPIIDLRQNPPKYVFLRANNYNDESNNGFNFQPRSYYMSIPGVSTNKLVQNPEYN